MRDFFPRVTIFLLGMGLMAVFMSVSGTAVNPKVAKEIAAVTAAYVAALYCPQVTPPAPEEKKE